MSSHAASGVLHALFLLLAFMTPATLILDAPPDWMIDEPMARFEAREVVIETGFHHPRTIDEFVETGRGGAPGDGEGDSAGPRAVVKVKSTPPDPDRALAAAPELAFIEAVGGVLNGFADDTMGPDTLMALGELDDGGGGSSLGGMGFGGAGAGASCGRVWETLKSGVKVVIHEGCKGIPLGGLGMMAGFGGRAGQAQPDLGDKDEASVRPTVLTQAPVGCTTAAACPWKEIIGKVIRRHQRELEFCYDRSLQRQKRGFAADINVSFGIAAAGGAADIALASTSGVGEFDDCIEARVARWVFPETGMPIRANYPFRFAVL